jgi:HlyD family secretion protein
MVVLVALLGGGAAAWAAGTGGPTGYVMAHVVRATVNNSLTLVGTVEPVTDASVAFEVGGKVASVTAAAGQQVTPGQSLATLDTTALSETVSSDQSTLASDEAKLSEDEANQSSSAAATTPSSSTTTTTSKPTSTGSSTPAATISADQDILTADEAITSVDQQQEAADLTQAEATCGTGSSGSTATTTPSSPSACTADLQQVTADQQKVSADQSKVTADEANLASALGDSSNSSSPAGSGTGSPTGSPTGTGTGTDTGTGGKGGTSSHAIAAANPSSSTGTNSPSASSSRSSSAGNGSSGNSDSPEQIAADQAAIDSAQADLINDQQSLAAAKLTSPISGTIVSVGIAAGDTVSAGSSTEVIVIIGTRSYEVSATLSSSQVSEVKVDDTAQVAIDGVSAPDQGTVSQVGPVESGSSGYSYPVVVALPTSVQGLFAGSSANVTIATGQVSDVTAVPTSAVLTVGARSYVQTLKDGKLARKVIDVGMVGSFYTEVRSGLSVGQSVVLADLSEAVPSSNANTVGGLGGGFGGFGGGGGRLRQFVSPGGGGGVVTIGG